VDFARESQGYAVPTEAGRTKSRLIPPCFLKKTKSLSLVQQLLFLFPEKSDVSPNKPIPRRSLIFYEILGYLADHPQAQDTVEGIVEWWVLEQRIKRATTQVKTALDQLVAAELVIARKGTAERVYYRVNKQKLHVIRNLLRE